MHHSRFDCCNSLLTFFIAKAHFAPIRIKALWEVFHLLSHRSTFSAFFAAGISKQLAFLNDFIDAWLSRQLAIKESGTEFASFAPLIKVVTSNKLEHFSPTKASVKIAWKILLVLNYFHQTVLYWILSNICGSLKFSEEEFRITASGVKENNKRGNCDIKFIILKRIIGEIWNKKHECGILKEIQSPSEKDFECKVRR